jgi:hypothetical protein
MPRRNSIDYLAVIAEPNHPTLIQPRGLEDASVSGGDQHFGDFVLRSSLRSRISAVSIAQRMASSVADTFSGQPLT